MQCSASVITVLHEAEAGCSPACTIAVWQSVRIRSIKRTVLSLSKRHKVKQGLPVKSVFQSRRWINPSRGGPIRSVLADEQLASCQLPIIPGSSPELMSFGHPFRIRHHGVESDATDVHQGRAEQGGKSILIFRHERDVG